MKKSESQNDWNRTNFLCSNFEFFFEIFESGQSFCGFSITSTILPSCHLAFICIWIILDYVRSLNTQRVIHRSTQCVIDGQENNNGKLALRFERCAKLFYLKKCRQRYGFLWFCGLNVQSNNFVINPFWDAPWPRNRHLVKWFFTEKLIRYWGSKWHGLRYIFFNFRNI